MENNSKRGDIFQMIIFTLISQTVAILYGFTITLLLCKALFPHKIKIDRKYYSLFFIIFGILLLVHLTYFIQSYPVVSKRYITLPLLVLISYLATQFKLLEVSIAKISSLLKFKYYHYIKIYIIPSFVLTVIIVGSSVSLHTKNDKSFLQELSPLLKENLSVNEPFLLFDAIEERRRILFYNQELKNKIITIPFKKNILRLGEFLVNEVSVYNDDNIKFFIIYRVQKELVNYNEDDFFNPVMVNYKIKNIKKFKTKRYIYYLSYFKHIM